MRATEAGTPYARPRVLLLAGSPRRGGNSDALLDALADGVGEAGGSVSRLAASELDIGGCRGDNACAKTGECRFRDDMDDVYAELDSADAVAIGTPVFFATVPSQMKALYDRMQPYWVRRYLLHEPAREPKRPGVLLLSGGGGDPFGSECAVTTTRSAMNVAGVEIIDVIAAHADRVGDVERSPEVLEAARAAGLALVSEAVRRGYS